MDLELYRPSPTEGVPGKGEDLQTSNPDFTIKIYWGSSQTVRDGQPKIFKMGSMTPEQMAQVQRMQRDSNPRMAGGYFYKPGWTTGYWPTKSQPGNIDPAASLPGTYALSTSYTGNVSLDVPSQVDFLAPIELSSPDLSTKVDLASFIAARWNPIPNALGIYATAFGMLDKNTMVLWTCAESYTDGMMGDMGFLQMAEVKQKVADKIFMPGDASSFDIPAGIFQGSQTTLMSMVAYGPGSAADNAQPLPRLQTKSSIMAILSSGR
jgi:hypothetical protein